MAVALYPPGRSAGLAKVVAAIGNPDFPEVLSDFCQPLSGCSSTVMALFHTGSPPRHLFNNLATSDERKTVQPYIAGTYFLDPFYDLIASGANDGLYLLRDVAPDAFFDSDYFRRYYRATRLLDEIVLLFRLGGNLHLLISFGLRDGDEGEPRTDPLGDMVPLLGSICRKHWHVWHSREPGDDTTFATQLELAYRNFGRGTLTEREHDVMLMLLKGHSNKSMARKLDISPETVKIHRRNLYSKVDVSSQSELFSVFLEALAAVPVGSDEDPLERYQRTGRVAHA